MYTSHINLHTLFYHVHISMNACLFRGLTWWCILTYLYVCVYACALSLSQTHSYILYNFTNSFAMKKAIPVFDNPNFLFQNVCLKKKTEKVNAQHLSIIQFFPVSLFLNVILRQQLCWLRNTVQLFITKILQKMS